MKYKCPLCDSGDLNDLIRTKQLKYKDVEFSLDNLKATECNNCTFEYISPSQKTFNEALIRDEHRKIDNYLTGNEIRHVRDTLGIKQDLASKVFGGGIHSFYKYESGKNTQSYAMDRLLRMTVEIPDSIYLLAGMSRELEKQIIEVRKVIDNQNIEIIDDFDAGYLFINKISSHKKTRQVVINIEIEIENGSIAA